MVWSSAMPDSVEKMIRKVFDGERKLLRAIWARDKMNLTEAQYKSKSTTIKDLQKIWDEPFRSARAEHEQFSDAEQTGHSSHSLLTTILLDDSPNKAALQPFNLLPIYEYSSKLNIADTRLRSNLEGRGNAGFATYFASRREIEPTYGPGYDDALLGVIGILSELRQAGNIARWIRERGLYRSARDSEEDATARAWFSSAESRHYWISKGVEALKKIEVDVRAY